MRYEVFPGRTNSGVRLASIFIQIKAPFVENNNSRIAEKLQICAPLVTLLIDFIDV